jgi:streptogrisin C
VARRRRSWLAAGAVAVIALTVTLAPPARATAVEPSDPVGSDRVALDRVGADPAMVAALRRDLGLSADEAVTRLAREEAAGLVESRVRAAVGDAFGGAWLAEPDQRLVVGVTDAAMADRVRALGAHPRLVRRGQAELDAMRSRLDAAGSPPASVSAWWVDAPTNQVVVAAGSAADAAAFIATSGVDRSAVRVVATPGRPAPLHDVRGGDMYTMDISFCSVGFSVTRITEPAVGGFVTAGHCGAAGETTSGFNGVDQGVVVASSHPGNDYAWVDVNSDWTPRALVNLHDGGTLAVRGWREAAVGASVCRSGATTGWRCGTIQAKNVTVNTRDGEAVFGLTRTSVCSSFGDSGGPFLNGSHGQGVTTSGDPNCSSTGTTFFQPLVEILDVYQLRLVTSGNTLTPPVILRVLCENQGRGSFSCVVNHYHPDAVQVRWKVNGVARAAWNDRSAVTGGCGIGQRMSISVTVSNASGSDTGGDSVVCEGDPQ